MREQGDIRPKTGRKKMSRPRRPYNPELGRIGREVMAAIPDPDEMDRQLAKLRDAVDLEDMAALRWTLDILYALVRWNRGRDGAQDGCAEKKLWDMSFLIKADTVQHLLEFQLEPEVDGPIAEGTVRDWMWLYAMGPKALEAHLATFAHPIGQNALRDWRKQQGLGELMPQ